ncbi:hypothetical protein FOCC_FOCC009279 [Frankliniella occidentalis]|nr:hypothetical protein FOCC_FOCC009279 [Frankliniella occidentalis]
MTLALAVLQVRSRSLGMPGPRGTADARFCDLVAAPPGSRVRAHGQHVGDGLQGTLRAHEYLVTFHRKLKWGGGARPGEGAEGGAGPTAVAGRGRLTQRLACF